MYDYFVIIFQGLYVIICKIGNFKRISLVRCESSRPCKVKDHLDSPDLHADLSSGLNKCWVHRHLGF